MCYGCYLIVVTEPERLLRFQDVGSVTCGDTVILFVNDEAIYVDWVFLLFLCYCCCQGDCYGFIDDDQADLNYFELVALLQQFKLIFMARRHSFCQDVFLLMLGSTWIPF